MLPGDRSQNVKIGTSKRFYSISICLGAKDTAKCENFNIETSYLENS